MPAPIMVLTTTIVARKGPSFLCATVESIAPGLLMAPERNLTLPAPCRIILRPICRCKLLWQALNARTESRP